MGGTGNRNVPTLFISKHLQISRGRELTAEKRKSKMKTEKRKPYEAPSVGVVESTCAVIAASNVTLGAPSEDSEDYPQVDNATWYE